MCGFHKVVLNVTLEQLLLSIYPVFTFYAFRFCLGKYFCIEIFVCYGLR